MECYGLEGAAVTYVFILHRRTEQPSTVFSSLFHLHMLLNSWGEVDLPYCNRASSNLEVILS